MKIYIYIYIYIYIVFFSAKVGSTVRQHNNTPPAYRTTRSRDGTNSNGDRSNPFTTILPPSASAIVGVAFCSSMSHYRHRNSSIIVVLRRLFVRSKQLCHLPCVTDATFWTVEFRRQEDSNVIILKN